MSFRIEDILKKENSVESSYNSGLLPWQRFAFSECNSILEQTLLNSRSYEGLKQPRDLYNSAELFASWYKCDKVPYLPMPYDAYIDKGKI